MFYGRNSLDSNINRIGVPYGDSEWYFYPLNHPLPFVMTMYMRNRLNNQVVNEVREHFGELAYQTIIQRNIRLGEAPSHGKPIMLYDASATGAVNYLSLAREFLKRNKTKRE